MKRRKRKLSPAYARRIARGLAKGLTRSQARGHPAVGEKYNSRKRRSSVNDHKLQLVIKEMKEGKSLSASARHSGLQPERVRRALKSAKLLRKRGRRWAIRDDIQTLMLVYSEGEAKSIVPADGRNRSAVGRFMNAVRQFLHTNNPKHLAPFPRKSVRDITGRRHKFETDENVLYRLKSAGSPSFEDIYEYILT
jgi:hypothetical protein